MSSRDTISAFFVKAVQESELVELEKKHAALTTKVQIQFKRIELFKEHIAKQKLQLETLQAELEKTSVASKTADHLEKMSISMRKNHMQLANQSIKSSFNSANSCKLQFIMNYQERKQQFDKQKKFFRTSLHATSGKFDAIEQRQEVLKENTKILDALNQEEVQLNQVAEDKEKLQQAQINQELEELAKLEQTMEELQKSLDDGNEGRLAEEVDGLKNKRKENRRKLKECDNDDDSSVYSTNTGESQMVIEKIATDNLSNASSFKDPNDFSMPKLVRTTPLVAKLSKRPPPSPLKKLGFRKPVSGFKIKSGKSKNLSTSPGSLLKRMRELRAPKRKTEAVMPKAPQASTSKSVPANSSEPKSVSVIVINKSTQPAEVSASITIQKSTAASSAAIRTPTKYAAIVEVTSDKATPEEAVQEKEVPKSVKKKVEFMEPEKNQEIEDVRPALQSIPEEVVEESIAEDDEVAPLFELGLEKVVVGITNGKYVRLEDTTSNAPGGKPCSDDESLFDTSVNTSKDIHAGENVSEFSFTSEDGSGDNDAGNFSMFGMTNKADMTDSLF